jgi:hypothetical protein
MVMHRGLFLTSLCSVFIGTAVNEVRAQGAVADTNNYIMSDFEITNPMSTPLNGFWFTYGDRLTATEIDTIMGNSRVTSFDSSTGGPLYDSLYNYDVKTFPIGRTGEVGSRSMRFAYELGDRRLSCGGTCTYDPYVGFGLTFTTLMDTAGNNILDFTGATAISFWAKAEKDSITVNISVGTKDTTTNASDYGKTLTISGPEWKKYTISLVEPTGLTQPSWAAKKPFDLKRATGIGFGINRGMNSLAPSNTLLIDDVVIENWKYVDPAEVVAVRSPNRAHASRSGGRLQIQGSQVRFIRADGVRLSPFNMNGRVQPVR